MGDFLSFRTMITPYIVQIVFWIGTLVCVVGGLNIFLGSSESTALEMIGGPATKFAGLLVIIVGPLLVRIWCELLIVLFRIHGSLVSIERQGGAHTGHG